VLGKSGPGWRRDTIGGRRMDMYFDLLEPALENFTLSEACSSRQRGNPYPSIFDEYAYPFRATMLPLVRKSASRKELELLADFKAYLEKSEYARIYGIPDNLSRQGLVARFLADMCYWRIIFRMMRPSLFLVLCSYGQEAPVAAARSLGIPTWELQHGMISEDHFGYNYGESARAHARELPLPERIVTFGSFFSDALVSCGYWTREQVPSLGFPRLSHFKRQLAAGARRDTGSRFNILVSTQWTLEDEYYDFVRQAVHLMPDNVRLVINPHPRSLARSIARLESLAGDRVEVMDKSSSMYERLGEIDMHCSVYSTTLFESAGLGIPTVVLGLPGWPNARVLLERQAATLAPDPAAFAQIVLQAIQTPGFLDQWKQSTAREGQYFFEPFNLEHARELLTPPARG
jgi:hypothetical protein